MFCFTPPCAESALSALELVQLSMAAFLGILFLQSGIDKVVDRTGNIEWLTGHFANSPLASQVVPMLSVITVIELAAGAFSALGVPWLLVTGSTSLATFGALLCIAAILMLFFGQRVAKDYEGAAVLAPYFLVACAALWVLGG